MICINGGKIGDVAKIRFCLEMGRVAIANCAPRMPQPHERECDRGVKFSPQAMLQRLLHTLQTVNQKKY